MKATITTDIVKLTTPEKADAAELFTLRINPLVNQYIERRIPATIADVEEFIEQRIADARDYYFVIKTITDNKLIGAACLKDIDKEKQYAEVGYELLPAFQGKGIMSNTLTAIINFAFNTLNLSTIEAYTHKENIASRNLLERFKFVLVPNKKDPDVDSNVIYCLKKK